LKIIANMLRGSISTLLCATQSAAALAEEHATGVHLVVVDEGTLPNTRGFLGCSLFSSADGFPESGNDVVEVRVPRAGATTRCEFRNVTAGIYAIAVMHDENDNRRLEKNFLGVPTEGYGVSNYKRYARSRAREGIRRVLARRTRSRPVGDDSAGTLESARSNPILAERKSTF
jgi:uncharacterized protein (DUF2141 family)